MKPPVSVVLPPEVVTTTFLAPAVPAGVTQVSEVALATATDVAAALPMATVVAPVTKFVPVTVTLVPPAVGPLLGLMALTVGAFV